jgi:hypothetical protein
MRVLAIIGDKGNHALYRREDSREPGILGVQRQDRKERVIKRLIDVIQRRQFREIIDPSQAKLGSVMALIVDLVHYFFAL